jgi:ATP-dependent DNA helicase RecQ
MGMLRDLRKRVSKIRTFVFSRSFTRRHGFKISFLHELIHIHGVGEGKAKKYGADFVELSQYVIDNEIL